MLPVRQPGILDAAAQSFGLVEGPGVPSKSYLRVLLVYLTLAGIVALLKTSEFQIALIVFGILMGLLWWLWSLLPEWFRKLVRRSIRRKERSHER